MFYDIGVRRKEKPETITKFMNIVAVKSRQLNAIFGAKFILANSNIWFVIAPLTYTIRSN